MQRVFLAEVEMHKQKFYFCIKSLYAADLNAHQIDILLHRLACQLIENHRDFSMCFNRFTSPEGLSLRSIDPTSD